MPLDHGPPRIDHGSPRVLFAELVAKALDRTGVSPSPHAAAYLVDLLAEAIRPDPDSAPETFTEGLLHAQRQCGAERVSRLRAPGDRALFLSGFFSDSLAERTVSVGWVVEVGRVAYADLSSLLASRKVAWTGSCLYRELAERFPQYSEVLTEVGDGVRAATSAGLAPLFQRYLRLGRTADRRRLLRRGLVVPEGRGKLQ